MDDSSSDTEDILGCNVSDVSSFQPYSFEPSPMVSVSTVQSGSDSDSDEEEMDLPEFMSRIVIADNHPVQPIPRIQPTDMSW